MERGRLAFRCSPQVVARAMTTSGTIIEDKAMTRLWLRLGVAGVGILIAGCEQPKQTSAVAQSAPVRLELPKIQTDVPLPKNFSIIEDESEERLTGTRRVYVRHRYEGRGDPLAVRKFYLEHMPEALWQLVSRSSVKGTHELRFQKHSEAATITISRARRWGKVRIEIMILQKD